ncbi:MAG: cobalamin-dependent protein [Ignavibacteriaceae bacterium]|nr:cobalamin-dependent protein [Ignavibacteriaceae bacterium]
MIHNEELNNQFFENLLSGRKDVCFRISEELLAEDMSIKELYETIIKPALYKIGRMWEYNQIGVATEHLATAITENILSSLYTSIRSTSKIGNSVILTCLENEFHQVGIKMVRDIFEKNGWDTFFLGANTPASNVVSLAKNIQPDVLAVSFSIFSNLAVLENMLVTFEKELEGLPILVGGQGFLHGGQEVLTKYTNVVYLPDLNTLEEFIITFKKMTV